MWLISTWSKNPELLIRACRALDQINWHKDGVVMWIQDAKPCPVLLSFYAEQNLTIEEHPVHQYLVDIPTALSFQIRYSFFSYFIRKRRKSEKPTFLLKPKILKKTTKQNKYFFVNSFIQTDKSLIG